MTLEHTDDPSSTSTALAERVYQGLWQAIVDGEFIGGLHLKERELSERFDVSRIPVRQALQRLEAEGLVTSERNRGARVALIGPDDVTELFDARLCIEPFATRRAAQRVAKGAVSVAHLHRLLRHSLAPTDGDVPGVPTLDFHAELVRLSGNGYLIRTMSPMLGRMRWIFQLTHQTRALEHAHDHEQLYEAVAAGRAELAEAQAHAHIEMAQGPIMEALARRLGW